jgi:hypothetical protein
MEVAVLSGHICNWGLSLLYAKRSALWRLLDCDMVGREVEARGTTRKLSAPGRARNFSEDFSSCTLWQNSPGHAIRRIVDLKGETPVGEQMCVVETGE